MECNKQETYRGTLKALTDLVCSRLSNMGDVSLVLQILEKVLLEQIVSLYFDNTYINHTNTFSYNNITCSWCRI